MPCPHALPCPCLATIWVISINGRGNETCQSQPCTCPRHRPCTHAPAPAGRVWAMPITDRGNWRSGSGRKGREASWEPARDRTRAEAGRAQDKVGHQGRTAPDRGPSNHTLNATHFSGKNYREHNMGLSFIRRQGFRSSAQRVGFFNIESGRVGYWTKSG